MPQRAPRPGAAGALRRSTLTRAARTSARWRRSARGRLLAGGLARIPLPSGSSTLPLSVVHSCCATPQGLSGSVVSVGSKSSRVIGSGVARSARPRARSAGHGRHIERRTSFRRRLCATADDTEESALAIGSRPLLPVIAEAGPLPPSTSGSRPLQLCRVRDNRNGRSAAPLKRPAALLLADRRAGACR